MLDDKLWSRRAFLATLAKTTGGAAVLGLAGCGGAPQPQASPTPLSKVPASIIEEAKRFKGRSLTAIAQQLYFTAANDAYAQGLSDFAQQTGTTVTNTNINADTGNFVAKQDAAVKAGNVQDMATAAASRFVAQLHQLDDIVPVTDTVNQLEKIYGPTADANRINLLLGGQWWGIPFYSSGSGWFIRKDWLQEKGIKESGLKSFKDARDIALEVSDPSQNRFGWGSTVNRSGDANGFILSVMNAYGSSITADNGRKVIFNSPETIEAITFLADIYTNSKYKKMLPPGILSWTDSSNNEAWLAGIIGFTNNAYSLYAQSKVQKNPVYDRTLTWPGFTGPGTDTVINTGDCLAFVVFKGAREPDFAKLLAQYLVDGDVMLNMVKASHGLILPAYDRIWHSDPYYLNGDPIFSTLYKILTQKLPIATKTGLHFPQSPSPGIQAVNQSYVLTDMMGDIIQKGVKVKDAVTTANQRMLDIFDQLGIKQ